MSISLGVDSTPDESRLSLDNGMFATRLRSFGHIEAAGLITSGAGAFVEADLTPMFSGGGTAAVDKPSYNYFDGGNQIIRGEAGWGTLGQPFTVTFAFRESGTPGGTATGFQEFNQQQIDVALQAFQSWSDVANITFVRVGTGDTGPGAYSNNATILLGNYTSGENGAAAFANFPGDDSFGSSSGDAWFNVSQSANANPQLGNYGWLTLVHEIGHTIGLAHPSDYNASETGNPTYENDALFAEDDHQYSVMSYFSEEKTGAEYLGYYPAAPQLYDISAAQQEYGANMSTRTGDDVYGFNSNTNRAWYSIADASQKTVFAVWDAGGNDTFDFSGYSDQQIIDLQQLHFSSVGPLVNNVAIAQGVVIENALGGSGADVITGNSANNFLSGNSGNDSLVGLDGDDTLRGGAGGDRLNGGTGVNLADYGAATAGLTASLATPAGNTGEAAGDQYTLIQGLIGSAFNDSLTGDANANVLRGGGGADLLVGGAGADSFDGGAGVDTVSFASATAGLNANMASTAGETGDAAGDTFTGVEILIGSGFNDSLTGDALVNTLQGGVGDDVLSGGVGADTLDGGAGNDTASYAGATGAVVANLTTLVVSGADGADVFLSIENLTGSAFNDGLTGDAGVNRMVGGGGDDNLEGMDGNDTIDGGLGNDTVRYVSASLAVTVDLLHGSATGGEGVDTLISIERVLGSSFNDVMTGNGLVNVMNGAGGDDTLNGGPGADTLTGGTGFDTVTYAGVANRVGVDLGAGTANGGGGLDVLVSIENAIGTDLNDAISGTGGVNILQGGLGDDTLDGKGGSDTLDGGGGTDTARFLTAKDPVVADLFTGVATSGTDTVLLIGIENLTGGRMGDDFTGDGQTNVLNGAGGTDLLIGGAGDDQLIGGKGGDTLTGGDGVDSFDFSKEKESGPKHHDLITDLTNSDVIDVSAIDADTTQGGNQAFTIVAAFDHVAGEMTLTYDAVHDITTIAMDANGDGKADMVIDVAGDHHDFTNFVL